MKQDKNKRKNKLPLAVVVCVLSVVVMIATLCCHKRETGEFVPPSFDETVQTGIPIVPDGLGWQELDATVFKVSVCGKVMVKETSADVWLTNPESNTVWLKLRVLDENGTILGETGLIRPSEYVQSVTLNTVPEVGTKIVLKVMSYQPDTYYSEGAVTLDTTISRAENEE